MINPEMKICPNAKQCIEISAIVCTHENNHEKKQDCKNIFITGYSCVPVKAKRKVMK